MMTRAFFVRVGSTPTFGPRVGVIPKIAVERKLEQGFHSGGYNHLVLFRNKCFKTIFTCIELTFN